MHYVPHCLNSSHYGFRGGVLLSVGIDIFASSVCDAKYARTLSYTEHSARVHFTYVFIVQPQGVPGLEADLRLELLGVQAHHGRPCSPVLARQHPHQAAGGGQHRLQLCLVHLVCMTPEGQQRLQQILLVLPQWD